jgi:hypothetical protein
MTAEAESYSQFLIKRTVINGPPTAAGSTLQEIDLPQALSGYPVYNSIQ